MTNELLKTIRDLFKKKKEKLEWRELQNWQKQSFRWADHVKSRHLHVQSSGSIEPRTSHFSTQYEAIPNSELPPSIRDFHVENMKRRMRETERQMQEVEAKHQREHAERLIQAALIIEEKKKKDEFINNKIAEFMEDNNDK